MLAIPLKQYHKLNYAMLLGLIYLLITIWFIPGYFVWDANIIAGLLSTVNIRQFSLRYLLPALITAVLAVMAPVNTMFFIAALFALLLLIENSIGKLNNMLLFFLVLISPVFAHITHLAEFPARLWVSDMVARVLSFSGANITAEGNQLVSGNYEFSVDPACAGLNMLVMSLLIGLFLLTFYQRQLGKQVRFIHVLMVCVVTVLLNIVCNFFRIMLLVNFKIMPGTFFHDLVGIGCLIIYVMLPLLVCLRPFVKRWGKEAISAPLLNTKTNNRGLRYPLLHLILLANVLFLATHLINADKLIVPSDNIRLKGYMKTAMDNGIIKLENKEALIYIKPTSFYAPEHDPMVCWTGSGYQFKKIKKERVAGFNIYMATLQKQKDKIYAAWWFDNGKLKTVDQLTWRWDAAKGKSRFYLVNVNAATPKALHSKVFRLLITKELFNNNPSQIKK
ncbi:exosortase N [Mucilaginibacter segetis]|uniref:Exosortase N n=1 Tax=Mucilaginibacter segetis TaxID=2793071 RepID=A0A934UPA3_9SPHI|nr:exosortase N [Mucilaginibacter segetis]MBK0380706.1 exosortase N [Mucilaginibacter segetis]